MAKYTTGPRKFNGKSYKYHGWVSKKVKATSIASARKRAGYNVRIVKQDVGYTLYTRKRNT